MLRRVCGNCNNGRLLSLPKCRLLSESGSHCNNSL